MFEVSKVIFATYDFYNNDKKTSETQSTTTTTVVQTKNNSSQNNSNSSGIYTKNQDIKNAQDKCS